METHAFVSSGDTLRQAGHRMRELGVTALRVRADDGSPRGIGSSDLFVRRIAAGGDPKYRTGGALPPEEPGALAAEVAAPLDDLCEGFSGHTPRVSA